MIAIHLNTGSFGNYWVEYCKKNNIQYKIVDCYNNDIIDKLSDCDALMWHHSHMNPKDILFAKQLLYSIEHSGKIVFPDFRTNWHFDDKLGQKYLFEALNCQAVKTYAFYKKEDALKWAENTTYPKVFKLRGGAGSWNVSLIKNKRNANKIISKAFGCGFKQYDAWSNINERWRKFRLGKINFSSLLMGYIRVFAEPDYSKVMGKERGYAYFQDFIPNNDSDIRVIVIDNKAFAIKRMVRENDFRASGSGNILYNKDFFDVKTIQMAFDLADKIQGQSVAFDFVFDNEKPLIVEVSYGFSKEGYDDCEGYWDRDMSWHQGKFDFCGWMVETVIEKIKLNEK
jgi:glutathione synthase/RimK-type ligase-like ATP-grasp enzyme